MTGSDYAKERCSCVITIFHTGKSSLFQAVSTKEAGTFSHVSLTFNSVANPFKELISNGGSAGYNGRNAFHEHETRLLVYAVSLRFPVICLSDYRLTSFVHQVRVQLKRLAKCTRLDF